MHVPEAMCCQSARCKAWRALDAGFDILRAFVWRVEALIGGTAALSAGQPMHTVLVTNDPALVLSPLDLPAHQKSPQFLLVNAQVTWLENYRGASQLGLGELVALPEA